jgi:hypothetical protein
MQTHSVHLAESFPGVSMGIEATITVVPRSEARKKHRTPKLPRFELYKEWDELDSALETLGSPACMALRGNKPTPDDEEWECQFFLVPPALVKRISKALRAISNDRLLAIIHEQRKKIGWRLRKYEHKEKISVFETLKAAYALAAKKNAYLQVFIG